MKEENPFIKILILEDNEIDKRLIYATIENSDLNHTSHIVDTKKDYVKALHNFKPDVVLADYVLPDFDGRQALELHKQIIPEVPFIFVTGQLSEETAINCMKLGAWDYIMKDHIKRLPVSIKNVLALRTERLANKQKEEIIIESEKRYKALSELTFEGIVIHNNGFIKDCNLSFCRLFGYDLHEMGDINVIDNLIHPNDRNRVRENIENRITFPYEITGIRKDGSTFPVEQEANRIIYNHEEVCVVAMRDITSRKEALEELKLSEEKFHKISNAAKDAIVLMDHNGKVSFWNKAATELFQYKEEEILGKNLHNMLAPKKYLESHRKGYKKFLLSGEGAAVGQMVELEAKRKNGEIFPIELSLSAIKMHGKWNAVGIIRDISIRKKAETEMLKAKKHAQDMNQMKTNFLSTVSHELRTPLGGILGYSELLQDCLENEDNIESARIIFESSQRLLNTVSLIIDLAALDANKVLVKRRPENIIDIIKNVCDSYLPEATEKKLYLNQNINVINPVAEIDSILLTQALNNLINNAIKFTKHGGITIKLSETKVNTIDCFVVSIADTGIGISKENIPIIYHEFRQVSEGYSREFEGLGLGLYITNKYINLLGGHIEVKSTQSKGSEFIIYFPKKEGVFLPEPIQKDKVAKVPAKADENTKPKILYVEDDINHQKFVELFLKNNYEITIVADGQKAINAVTQNMYDLILMDINLGVGMDGLEVVKKIREIPSYKDVPIVAVTANALVSQKNTFLNNGCSHYLAKPFRKRMLLDFIEKALAQS